MKKSLIHPLLLSVALLAGVATTGTAYASICWAEPGSSADKCMEMCSAAETWLGYIMCY